MNTNSPEIRFGIIGFRMGFTHAQKFDATPGAHLVAIAELDAAAQSDAESFGARYYGDYRAMLDGETLDAVIVALPHFLLSSVGIECLQRGLHVLVEKPMAHTLEAARKLCAARQGEQILGVGYNWRQHCDVRRVQAMMRAGELGQIALGGGSYLGYSSTEYYGSAWRGERDKGGGPTLVLASHCVDTFRFLLGEVRDVSARFTKARGLSVEDSAVISLRFACGALVTIQASNSMIGVPRREFWLGGDVAAVQWPPLTRYFHPWLAPHNLYRERQGLVPVARDYTPRDDAYRDQLANFCAAIRGEEEFACPGEEALKTFEVLWRAIEAGEAEWKRFNEE